MGPFGGIAMAMDPKRQEEMRFQRWYAQIANKLGIDANPDAPEHHYDNRGFFRSMEAGHAVSPDKPGGHFPSTFKTEGHPRTYLDDTRGKIFDTRTATYLDGSPVPPHLLRASERSPDMPGFQPPQSGLIPADFPSLGYNDQRSGQGSMPFRDPEQMGPAPPSRESFASLYGKGRQ